MTYPLKRKIDKDQPKVPAKRGRPPLSEKLQAQTPPVRKEPEAVKDISRQTVVPHREPGIRLPALRLKNKTVIQVRLIS